MPCCKFIKHLPYNGECEKACFSTFLIGSFPSYDEDDPVKENIRPYVTEWMVPAEVEGCLAYKDRLCSIYESRPLACRNFPLISKGKFHEFCKMGEYFLEQDFCESDFTKKVDRLDIFLIEMLRQKGEKGLSYILMEERPFRLPLLYNSYLALVLLINCREIFRPLENQILLLKRFQEMGLKEITVLIPGTEFCITGEIDGLMANLNFLIYRLKEQGLLEHLRRILTEIFQS